MRTLLIMLFAITMSWQAQADQLAYITKSQAEEAVRYINKHPIIYLFCGCCFLVEPEKVTVIEAKAMHTGYEDYYEVEIKYKDGAGNIKTEKIDLAYVWRKKIFKYKTIGQELDLEHDICTYLKNWDVEPEEEEI